MVLEQRGDYPSLRAAAQSIAPKIGCVPHTVYEWVRRHEVDTCVRYGVTTAEKERVKELEREVKELRRTNEILKLASRVIGDWIGFYNHRRPHQALNMRTPAETFAYAA
jgi:transposase